jgi:hypothetical protein
MFGSMQLSEEKYLQEKKERAQQQQLTFNASSLSPYNIHSFSLMAKQNSSYKILLLLK